MAIKFYKNKNILIVIIFISILVVASFFRLWQLNSIPPGLWPDVAMNATNAIETLKTGDFKVFYPENNGREGLFIWLIAFSFWIFGPSIFAIKIVPAAIGILTVFGIYFLTKELLGVAIDKEKTSHEIIALLSSFFLAVSFWHVNFSRLGFRAILVPFILVFAFYFLLRAFRTYRLSDFIISGLFWGLGFYTYTSFRLAVLIVALFLILKFIEYLKQTKSPHLPIGSRGKLKYNWKWLWSKLYIKDNWWKVDVFLVVILLVALPIGIYFLQNPQDFTKTISGRATSISVFAKENPVKELGKSLILHLGMFNFFGDTNWRHNFAGSPLLFWPVGILFIVGVILSVREFIISWKNKNWPLITIHSLLLSWFLVMLLPGVLTAEGVPHSLRTIGVIPPVFIFAGIGGEFLYQKLRRTTLWQLAKNNSPLTILTLVILILSFVFAQYLQYFDLWANNPEVQGAFTKKFVEVGEYLNSLPEEIQKYVIVNETDVRVRGVPVAAQTPIFIETLKFGAPRSIYLAPENWEQIKTDSKTAVVLPLKYDKELETNLLQKFPEVITGEINGIWIYLIP